MIQLHDMPMLLRLYSEGTLSERDMFGYALELIETHDVQDVVAALPESLRVAFLAMARAEYDNDVPAEDFISVESYCGIGEPQKPDTASLVRRIRAWLASQANS